MSAKGLEYTFAVNLINFVMEHRKMGWKFHKYFLKNIRSTSLSPTIQNFVLEYLEDEETNIYFVYMIVTKASKVDCDMFYYVAEHLRRSIFSSVNTVTEVIRYCTLISQCSILAYQRGVHLAPFVALKEVSEAMEIFISEKEETSSTFWASLDSEVSKLLPESFSSSPLIVSPMKEAKFLQEPTSDLDETHKEQRGHSPPEQVLEIYLMDDEENIQDERKNLILMRLQANITFRNEEQMLLTQRKAIKEKQLQQVFYLQKCDQHEDLGNLLEKTDLPPECEKEKNPSQQGFITHTIQIQEIQIPDSEQLLKLEVVKDLLDEPTLKIQSHPQNTNQLQDPVKVKSFVQLCQTLSDTHSHSKCSKPARDSTRESKQTRGVQQDEARVGKAFQQDEYRVGKAMQQDQARIGEAVQQDQARVGKAMQQDQSRVGEAVQQYQARVGKAVQQVQARIGKTMQKDQSLVGKAVQKDQARTGKAVQQDQSRVAEAVQQDQTRTGKALQQDQARVGEAVQQDQARVAEAVQQDQARVAEAVQQDQARAGKAAQQDQARAAEAAQDQARAAEAVQQDQGRAGKAVREDLENIKNLLKEKGKNVVRDDQKGNLISLLLFR
ncbi:hypothetical protein TNCT_613291 [Trichonephila clavata]|uniref:Uncharacterized protein n=1 Tax=Trichonephila clavata TaxID=2740835 RepID=A0A8X6IX51_TRICU|nr:hypothetical protein TNCT_613291 [Trichonephila clavata]